MTFRQVYHLLEIINEARLITYYDMLSSYGIIHGAKLPSLDEFLSLSLGEKANVTPMDKATDDALDKHALEMLERKRKQANGE